MVDSILKAAGKKAIQVGNVGMPSCTPLPMMSLWFFAVELSASSCTGPIRCPRYASVVLNIADEAAHEKHGSWD